jgi:hypothetical protein
MLIPPRLETIQAPEFLPPAANQACGELARLSAGDDERGDRRNVAQIEHG